MGLGWCAALPALDAWRPRGLLVLLVLLIGLQAPFAAAEAFGPGGRHFEAVEPLLEAARNEAGTGATLLVKGSRFMRMERVADALAGSPRGHHAA